MQYTIQDTDFFRAVESLLRKLHIMLEAQRFGNAARSALKRLDYHAAEMAMNKYDELTKMI